VGPQKQQPLVSIAVCRKRTVRPEVSEPSEPGHSFAPEDFIPGALHGFRMISEWFQARFRTFTSAER
jgi:hypothetical protein